MSGRLDEIRRRSAENSRPYAPPVLSGLHEVEDVSKLTLWRHPIHTTALFAIVVYRFVKQPVDYLLSRPILLAVLVNLVFLVGILVSTEGPHQMVVAIASENVYFVLYWVGLGILSSVGLGTGLHTFILYLAPHIAKTTMTAYGCNSLAFDDGFGPHQFVCSQDPVISAAFPVSFLGIAQKVWPESFLWGLGTAIGELPPYFVARAARIAGQSVDELDEVSQLKASGPGGADISFIDSCKIRIYDSLTRFGFLAILLFASIPNPLFDLAGILCGHFLVSFWTFFGATTIGKAVVKAMFLQTFFVIFVFSGSHAETLISMIPIESLREKALLSIEKSRASYTKEGSTVMPEQNAFSLVWDIFLTLMVVGFLISIVHSSVQSLAKELKDEAQNDRRKKTVIASI